ncbi:MAG TPA: 16S rRNA (guanine(527)-N(7))-methyltransferase RsmG [Bordetella sp.]
MNQAVATSADFARRLTAACQQLGLRASDAQRDKLLRYVEQMQRWNRTYNLTAVRDAGQMLVQHVFDSLAVARPIENETADNETAPRPLRIMDVGSGGGLPGVVLAILHDRWRVQCVDAVDKKMAFVRQISGALALPNLQASHARVETLPQAGCDVVVSRAFASLLDFANLAGLHVHEKGSLLAMKGKTPEDEIAALHAQGVWRVRRIETLHVPELDAQRCLVWMRRTGQA